MSKSKLVDFSELGSVSLFRKPVAYTSKPMRRTMIIVPFDNDGVSVPKLECIEDKMSQIIALDYHDVTLSNLVSKGVETHSLDMIDTSKMGVDAGVDALANHIVNNANDYVEFPKSE